MKKNITELNKSIKLFQKRYYKLKFYKGLIYFLILLLSYILLIIFSENIFYFNKTVRALYFYMLILFSTYFLLFNFIIPFLKIFRIGKVLSESQIIDLISLHFPEHKDKLKNIVELNHLKDTNNSIELINAAILQKIDSFDTLNFKSRIQFKISRLIVLFSIVIFLLFCITFFTKNNIYKTSFNRIVNYQKKFSKPAPFEIKLLTKILKAKKGDDIKIEAKTHGAKLPSNLYIKINSHNFLMLKKNNVFSYLIKNIDSNISFQIYYANVSSPIYTISCLNKPNLMNFSIQIMPPKYTRRAKKEIENIGDINVPSGSKLKWKFNTKFTDSLYFYKDSIPYICTKNDKFVYKTSALKSFTYFIKGINSNYTDTLINYKINIVKDEYPTIKVKTFKDSINDGIFYFKGFITDDYGFSKLNLYIEEKDTLIDLKINKNLKTQIFNYALNFNNLNIKEGETFNYYFKVSDNDVLNNYKTTKSSVLSFKKRSLKEKYDDAKQNTKNVKNSLKKSAKLASEVVKDIEKINETLLDQNVSEWERNQMFENILEKKNKIQDLLRKSINDFNKNTISKEDSLIFAKKKEIENLIKKLFDKELQKLISDFNKLKKNFNQKSFNQKKDRLTSKFNELKEKLDRNLDLLKRLEIESKFKELAKRSNNLDKKLNNGNVPREKLVKETKELINDLKENLKSNNQLKKPFAPPNLKNELKQLDKFVKNQNKIKQAQKSLKSISKKINNSLQLDQNNSKQIEKEKLIAILDNLFNFSFLQEELYELFRNLNFNDPNLDHNLETQNNIKKKFFIIKDSIQTIADKNPFIAKIFNDKIYDLKNYIEEIENKIKDNNVYSITTKQRFVITESNNLILLLSEVLRQSTNSSQQSSKSSKGNSSMPNLSQLQKQMKRQLKDMMKNLKQMQNKSSKQLGQMFKNSEMLRKNIEKLANNNNNSEFQKRLRQIEQLLKQNERDFIYKNFNNNTLKRQKAIIKHMLAAEKAIKEQGKSKKRKSNYSKQKFNITSLRKQFENKLINVKFEEEINKNNLELNFYFERLFKKYLNLLNQGNE